MRDLAILAVHLIVTVAKLLPPGGARSVVSESLLLKHQLLILNRSRARAPNLRPIDRVIASLCAGLMRPARLRRSAIVLKPSTLMAFHRALVNCKYRLLFAPTRRKPGISFDTRWAVLLFGFAHGFGLSTTLQDLSLSEDGLVPNMIAFNIGVELGQFAALGLILIAFNIWRRSSTFFRTAYATNVGIIGAGFALFGYQMAGYWVG